MIPVDRRKITALLLFASAAFAQTPVKPKLVVVVVLDQFRYDYLTRFRADYHAGLDRMLRQGAVFTEARYTQSPTVTAVGHSIITTGAMPSISGIVGNSWFDRLSSKAVTSVCDYKYKLVGAETQRPGAKCEDWDPASPRRMLVSSIGDELKNRDERSKVFGISIKARSAILPSGHRADGALWFDDREGAFISSDYYYSDLPGWVKDFNALGLAREALDRKWEGFDTWDFHPDPIMRTFEKIPASPWGNELIEKLAEKAIVAEKLGQREATDLLTLSFSSNDYVGHQTGPDAPEVRDLAIRCDQLLGNLMDLIGQKVGLDKALFVISADHGVAPAPEVQEQRKMPGGYVWVDVVDIVRSAFERKFGPGELILGNVDNAIYFDYKAIDKRKLEVSDLYRTAKIALFAVPQAHVARVITRDQLEQGPTNDPLARAAAATFFPSRSGDVLIYYEPFWMPGQSPPGKVTHFTPYNYDSHVPVIFFGTGIRPGVYREGIEINDIAPTMATLMDIERPTGAFGRVLTEAIEGGEFAAPRPGPTTSRTQESHDR
jgi:predicted AlkP superfamily pyrophosphatase or phosphodiesterase